MNVRNLTPEQLAALLASERKNAKLRKKIIDSVIITRKLEKAIGREWLNEYLIENNYISKDLIYTDDGSQTLILELAKEIEILKAKLKQQQILKNILAREQATKDTVLEYLGKTIKALPPVKPNYPKNKKHKKVVEAAVAVFSCWHIGEVVKPEQVNNLNKYDFETFVKRLQYLTDKIIKFTTVNMGYHSFDEIHLIFTGDMVSGIIHDELIETNDLTITEQAVLGAYVTAQAISEIAQNFPNVIATCVVGNHGRITKAKYAKNKQVTNWDYVFYHMLKLYLSKHENVTFLIPESHAAVLNIKGHNFVIFHGDQIKGWGGIPFYGLNRISYRYLQIGVAKEEFYKYFISSHYHTKISLQFAHGEQILNGSMKGTDEYSFASGLSSDPYQLIFGVHPKYGKTWELSINLKYADEEVKNIRYKFNKEALKDKNLLI